MKNPIPNFQRLSKSLSFFLLHSSFSIRHSLFFFISLLVLPFSLYSQNTKIDSLLSLLKKDKEDTNKVNHFNAVVSQLVNSDPQKIQLYAEKALTLAQKIKWLKGIGDSYISIGYGYYFQSDFSNALKYWERGLHIKEELKDKKGVIKILGNIGVVYYQQTNYPKALKFYFKVLKIAEELRDKQLISMQLGNIGLVYSEQADYPRGLNFYFKALKLKEELLAEANRKGKPDETENCKKELAFTYGNIGTIYFKQSDYSNALKHYSIAINTAKKLGIKYLIANMLGNIGNVYKAQNDYPIALDYYFSALKTSEEIGDKNHVANELGNIGSVYFTQSNVVGIPPLQRDSLRKKALDYYFKALEMSKNTGIKKGMVIWSCNIGLVNIKTGNFTEAEKYLLQSLRISDEIQELDHRMVVEKAISQLYDTTQRFQLAYEHYKKFTVAKDTIFNEEKSKDIGRLEQKHEYEMAELKRQQEEKERSRQMAVALSRRNTLEYSAILLGIFALFVIVFFVARFNLPHWAVELVVFIPFLILFEFALVLLDPYIESVTGGEPVWKLLVNALLAAVIFPIHGYFERMLKKRVGSHSPEASD